MRSNVGSLLNRLVGACLCLLVGSAAVYLAICLINAVLTELLIIITVVGLVVIGIAVMRARSNSW